PLGLNTTLHQNISCNGGNNGAITTTGSGGKTPYTYLWNNGTTIKSRTGLAASNYTLTVTDNKGCVYTQTFNITQPAVLSISTSKTNVSVNGGNDGSATATVTGGTSPYSYSWNTSPVKTTSNATGLVAGTYTVTVTDANSCTATKSVTITQPGARLMDSDNLSFNLHVYPNPTSDVLNIAFDHIIDGEVAVRIYTQYGAIVYTSNRIVEDALQLDLKHLAKGVYYVNVECLGLRFNKRIVLH
ncbi:MAG: T9SS type A sorting domain-containing protein, partial [Bacteroidia bacterium]|nr:T9SS type A sorting domain-containing protein [Bacteroidia bacterium]